MNADVLEVISIVAFVLAAIFALIAIILFFKLNVKAILDDLSGKKAERHIRAYREQGVVARKRVSVASGQRDYYNPVTQKTEEATERLQVAGNADSEEDTVLLEEEGTMVLDSSSKEPTQECSILFDEMIIHTGEEISL